MEVIRQVEQERQAARIEEKRHDHPKAMATKCGPTRLKNQERNTKW
jgi:hypothetical protein